jgi:hypothetical protein
MTQPIDAVKTSRRLQACKAFSISCVHSLLSIGIFDITVVVSDHNPRSVLSLPAFLAIVHVKQKPFNRALFFPTLLPLAV